MDSQQVDMMLSVLLGLVFLASSLPKLRSPKGFMLRVLEYRILPAPLARTYARLLGPIELLLAVLLLTGAAIRLASAVACGLLLSFIFAIAVNLIRGRDIDCGCYGSGSRRRISWRVLVEDAALVVTAGITAWLAGGWTDLSSLSVFRFLGISNVSQLDAVGFCLAIVGCVVIVLRTDSRMRRGSTSLPSFRARRRAVEKVRTGQ